MKKNVGNADRTIRIILGVIIVILGFYFNSWLGIIGLVPILTGLMNFCPAYSLIGVSTQKKVETEKLKI